MTTVQTMLFCTTDKNFNQIDLGTNLYQRKTFQILKLLFSQAMTASRVPADGCGLACYL